MCVCVEISLDCLSGEFLCVRICVIVSESDKLKIALLAQYCQQITSRNATVIVHFEAEPLLKPLTCVMSVEKHFQ